MLFIKYIRPIVFQAKDFTGALERNSIETTQLMITLFLSPLSENFVKYFYDYINKNSMVNEAWVKALATKSILKQDIDPVYFNDYIERNKSSVITRINNSLEILYNKFNVMDRYFSLVLFGPPGTGKTSLMKSLVHLIYERVTQNCDKPINGNLEDDHIKMIKKQRKMHQEGNLIIPILIAGSFFAKYENEQLKVFDEFVNSIIKMLQSGHIVVLCIDEVDALVSPEGSPMRSEFLVLFDRLLNFNKSGKYHGFLIVISTTNGNSSFDYAMSRRIFQEVINFPYPGKQDQSRIFFNKYNEFIQMFDDTDAKRMFAEKIEGVNIDFMSNYISIWNKYGIALTGSEIKNILSGYFSIVLSDDKHFYSFGETKNQAIENLLLYYMFQESFKILTIRDEKSRADYIKIMKNILRDVNRSRGKGNHYPFPVTGLPEE